MTLSPEIHSCKEASMPCCELNLNRQSLRRAVPDFFHILSVLLVHRSKVVNIQVVDDQQVIKLLHLDPSIGRP